MKAKMIFLLRQDTPMIHFQGGTEGAVLRTSEVKPKLDRFLTEWCERKGIEKEKREEWKADKDHDAFDYKMRIYIGNSENRNKTEIYKQAVKRGGQNKLPSYFGYLDEHKINLWYIDDIQLEILCFHDSLRKVIYESIETFFVLHNFGTRQNRGIGGFTLKGTTAERAEKLLVGWYMSRKITVYKMVFCQGMTPKGMLKCGNMYYQILKSGINQKETYIKSYLTEYFLNRRVKGNPTPQLIGGEKRWMKEKGISPAIGKSAEEYNNRREINDYRYIRGLLGIAGSVEYISELDSDGKPVKVFYTERKKEVIKKDKIVISNRELKRVPSPIRYKLVGQVLFIIPLEPLPEIYGVEFMFKNKNTGEGDSLSVPNCNDFRMEEMMEGYIQYLNREDVNKQIEKFVRRNQIPLPILTEKTGTRIQLCKGDEQQ